MTVGEKIRHLRAVEGSLRGLDRPLTQGEVVGGIQRELRQRLSQSYLSQIESGARPHMTHKTRQLLARFFKVQPGFLVDDAEGFQTSLKSDLRAKDAKMDSWLYAAAETFGEDKPFREALQSIADFPDTRKALLLLGEIVAVPGLADDLYSTLRIGRREPAQSEEVEAP